MVQGVKPVPLVLGVLWWLTILQAVLSQLGMQHLPALHCRPMSCTAGARDALHCEPRGTAVRAATGGAACSPMRAAAASRT